MNIVDFDSRYSIAQCPACRGAGKVWRNNLDPARYTTCGVCLGSGEDQTAPPERRSRRAA